MWPRPINGSGHFRELCDVTMHHLAGLCNFGTLSRPIAQPQQCHALPRSCGNPKKAFLFLACPELWPRPINGSGHFRELCDVTTRHLAGFVILGQCPEINPCPIAQPQQCHALPRSCGNPKKAFLFLACPELWPRPINGSGHFRELCDVTTRHLAGFVILGHCPEINPCPIAQPQQCHALPRSCRNPKKTFLFMACPEMWPRPINGSGHFRELCDVTMHHLAGLCNFGTLSRN